MLKCINIHKSFSGIDVLKGVDMSLSAKEVVSIIGVSGAGKTTLLHILGTLMKPDKGTVLINGVDVSTLKASEIAQIRNKEIGFVFQFHHLLPEFSAIENIMIPALIAGGKSSDIKKNAQRLMSIVGLSSRERNKPAELSGGEQQRVAVARALINKPSIVFADEPSGNLDTKNKDELHELFFNLKQEFEQTFLIVTHDKELAARSDRQIVMSDGLIISH